MEITRFYRVYKHSEMFGWLPLMYLDEASELWASLVVDSSKLRLVAFCPQLDMEQNGHGIIQLGGKL